MAKQLKLALIKDQTGTILLAIIIMMPMFMLIAASFMQLSVTNYQVARVDQYRTHAQFSVDAGIDATMEKINLDPESYVGTLGTPEADANGEVEIPGSGDVRRTYEIEVVTPDSDHKTIIATGRTYFPATNSIPSSTVTINTELRPVRSGEFSVVGGVGGLIMTNSSKILGGDVHINGKISMSNSSQIGQTTSPVNLYVAHQTCPNPPTAAYPQICSSGQDGQPITQTNSSHIYGNVRANNQTNGTKMSLPGLTSSSGVAAEELPEYTRNAQIAAVASTQTGSSAGCSSGNKTWPANLKITGDVSISNSCKVTVSGNVWITGKLTVSNSADMIVGEGNGGTKPVLMIDGDEAKFSNSAELKSNSGGTGFYVITYKSVNGCTTATSACASISGPDLYNSRNIQTIELSNSSEGPNTIFYARWSKVKVTNSGAIGALIGQTIDLSNSGAITFGTSTGIGTEYWVIDSVRRTFN